MMNGQVVDAEGTSYAAPAVVGQDPETLPNLLDQLLNFGTTLGWPCSQLPDVSLERLDEQSI